MMYLFIKQYLFENLNKLNSMKFVPFDDIKGNDIVPDGAILFKNANYN